MTPNESWEYLTKFVTASTRSSGVLDFLKRYRPDWKKIPEHTPEAMMPELDALGEQGWELVHMEPVASVGKKGDIMFSNTVWSSTYFCVFKRRKMVAP